MLIDSERSHLPNYKRVFNQVIDLFLNSIFAYSTQTLHYQYECVCPRVRMSCLKGVCVHEGEIDPVLLFDCVSLWFQGRSALSTDKISSRPDGSPQGRDKLMINLSPFLSFNLTHMCDSVMHILSAGLCHASYQELDGGLICLLQTCHVHHGIMAGRQIFKSSWNTKYKI